jgi:hypothetical protein
VFTFNRYSARLVQTFLAPIKRLVPTAVVIAEADDSFKELHPVRDIFKALRIRAERNRSSIITAWADGMNRHTPFKDPCTVQTLR